MHFTNIAVESLIFCTIVTFCNLQPSVGFASKYQVSRLRNYQQDVSRVSFLRRTRFWTLFFSQTVGKSPKSRFVVATPFCFFQVLITPDAVRLTPCVKNWGFGDFATVWQKNKVQKRVLREKRTLETSCLLFLILLARYFETRLAIGWREQNGPILHDSSAMLVKCTLLTSNQILDVKEP